MECFTHDLFSDVKYAFAYRSKAKIFKSLVLFYLVQFKGLVDIGIKLIFLLIKHFPFLNFIVKRTLFEQFCGGETIAECLPVIKKMSHYGVGSILDYSKENSVDVAELEKTTAEILRTIENAAALKDSIPFCVFKISALCNPELLKIKQTRQLSLQESILFSEIENRVELICRTAYQNKVCIMIDAEESWIQSSIDDLVKSMMRKFNQTDAIVYSTYQMYLTNKISQLKNDLNDAKLQGYFLGVKLVRGAYMEKERIRSIQLGYASPIVEDKMLCDKAYSEALEFCIANQEIKLVVATHNEKSCLDAANLMQQHKNASGRIFFSQLYGMGDHISFNLAQAGFKVAKYLPYGAVQDALPYLFRRAEENRSVQGLQSREYTILKRYFF